MDLSSSDLPLKYLVVESLCFRAIYASQFSRYPSLLHGMWKRLCLGGSLAALLLRRHLPSSEELSRIFGIQLIEHMESVSLLPLLSQGLSQVCEVAPLLLCLTSANEDFFRTDHRGICDPVLPWLAMDCLDHYDHGGLVWLHWVLCDTRDISCQNSPDKGEKTPT